MRIERAREKECASVRVRGKGGEREDFIGSRVMM